MNPTTDLIAPQAFEERIDHGDDVITAWMAGEQPRALERFGRGVTDLEVAELLRRTSSSVVEIALTARAPDVLRAFVRERARAGAPRTYVHLPESMTTEAAGWVRAAGAGSSVVFRFGASPPADWVVFGDEAMLFIGPSGAAPRWVLDLGAAQARSLGSVFAWLFWHRATRELLPGDADAATAHPGVEPDAIGTSDAVQLPAGVLCPRGSEPAHPAHADIAVLPAGFEWPGAARVVFTAPEATPLPAAEQRARAGATCVSAALDLPTAYLSSDRVGLVLGETRLALRLDLDGPLATELYQVVDDVARRPAWRFHQTLRLSDAVGPIRRGPKQAIETVEAETVVDDGTVEAPELDPSTTARPPLGQPKRLARTWVHRWRVTPPVAPTGARAAGLYEAWRQVDAFARTQADLVRQRLGSSDANEAGLSESAAFERRRRAIEAALDEVTETPLSAQPEAASRLLDQLVAQRAAADELLEAIAEARHTEREATRRAQAEKSHEERITQAAHDLEARTRERATHEEALAKARTALEAAKDKHARKSASRKVEDATRAMAACDQAMQKLRPVLDARFVFTPSPRKPSARAALPVTPAVPDEALPAVGHLVEHGGRRFLELERWPQLEAAREDARRLDARLVAVRGTH